MNLLQVNIFQKHLFLHQPTHNMTIDCGLIDAKTRASDKDLPVYYYLDKTRLHGKGFRGDN